MDVNQYQKVEVGIRRSIVYVKKSGFPKYEDEEHPVHVRESSKQDYTLLINPGQVKNYQKELQSIPKRS